MSFRKLFVFIILFLFSCVAAFSIAFDDATPTEYEALFLLPIGFIFALFIVFPVIDIVLSRVSTIVVVAVYFLRTVVIPFVMRIGYYNTLVSINRYSSYAFPAIILIVYETIAVFVFIRLKTRKLAEEESLIDSKNIRQSNLYSRERKAVFILVLVSFVSYVAIMLIRDPSLLRSNFVLLVGTPDDWKTETNYASIGDSNRGGTLGILVTLMNQIISFILVFVPALLVRRISKRSNILKYVFFALIIGFIAIVGTEERFRSIDYSIALIFTIKALDNRKYKKFTNVLILGIIAIAFIGLIQKSYAGSADYSTKQLSGAFSAYFSSVPGVAAAIPFSDSLGRFNLFRLPTDIITMVPYVKSLLSKVLPENIGRMYNLFLTGTSKSMGQIIPSIGLGYVYFGFILAPIIPIITVYFAMNFEAKARASTEIVYKNLFYAAAIMLARCCGQSSFLQCISSLCNIGIMYLLPRMFLGRNKVLKKDEDV